MRKAFLTISVLFLFCTACNSNKETLMKEVEKADNTVYVNDKQFITDAHNAVMMNVFLGRLAERNASSDIVKKLANSLTDDCCLSHAELKRIALSGKIPFTDDLSSKKQEQYNAFAKVKGKAFDKAFMRYILKEHHADLSFYEEEAIKGSIKDLKLWAESEAGITRHRLEVAQIAMDKFESPK